MPYLTAISWRKHLYETSLIIVRPLYELHPLGLTGHKKNVDNGAFSGVHLFLYRTGGLYNKKYSGRGRGEGGGK